MQSLGCSGFFDMKDCDNANGKAVKGTKPSLNDSNEVILKKIVLASQFMDRFVVWRVCIIVSVAATLLLYFINASRLPTEVELITAVLSIAALGYFALNFYKFHMVSYIEKNIAEGATILKQRGI